MKILLAEDERDLSAAIVRVLKFNKFDVYAVYDGEEALDYLSYSEYDGVILDVMMPKKDGFAVVKAMREKGNKTPVLMLTARSDIEDKVKGLDLGADDYLTKPFVIPELLARVRALTRRKSGYTETYKIGNFSLNFDTFELCGTKNVRLTNKEYKLMEYLIRNKDVLLSTEKIMENVWDYDSAAEINVVWVFISALRKKLEEIGADYTIKAVRGVGYRLEKK
ncbi:MAG: response regulator transcription factor [Clostridia bacterium]|nr:response regulator transcription factor [Clostridia bacterium]